MIVKLTLENWTTGLSTNVQVKVISTLNVSLMSLFTPVTAYAQSTLMHALGRVHKKSEYTDAVRLNRLAMGE